MASAKSKGNRSGEQVARSQAMVKLLRCSSIIRRRTVSSCLWVHASQILALADDDKESGVPPSGLISP
jgi:hypothetical protein